MKLLYILANHRTGSTLTDFALTSLKSSVSLGEIVRLSMDETTRIRSFGNRCQCKQRISECDYWLELKKPLFEHLGLDPTKDWQSLKLYPHHSSSHKLVQKAFAYCINKVSHDKLLQMYYPYIISQYAENSWRFFEAFSEITQSKFLIDSSKTFTRFLSLYRLNPEKVFLIFLTRDGRGTLASHLKHINCPSERQIKQQIQHLSAETNRMYKVFTKVPEYQKIHIKYEDLCIDPNHVLNRVANKLNCETQPFENLVGKTFHSIPGSEHTVIRKTTLNQDKSWESKLSPKALKIYNQFGDSVYKQFGYI